MSENVNVSEYIESKCVHVEADCFDLEQIMESGQCFRIYKLSLQEQEKLCKSKGLERCESMAWYRVMAADKKVFPSSSTPSGMFINPLATALAGSGLD